MVSRVRPCSLAPDMHCAVVQVIEKELFSLEVLFSLDVVLFSLAVFSTFVVFARSDILFSLDVFSTFLGTSATE